MIFAVVGDPGEEVELEVATDDGSRAQDLFGVLTEPGDAATDDLPDAGRQPVFVAEVDRRDPAAIVALRDRAGLGEVPQDLAREERVPVGLPDTTRGRARRRRRSIGCPAAASTKATISASSEATQVNALHVLFAMQGREHIGEWMLGAQVGLDGRCRQPRAGAGRSTRSRAATTTVTACRPSAGPPAPAGPDSRCTLERGVRPPRRTAEYRSASVSPDGAGDWSPTRCASSGTSRASWPPCRATWLASRLRGFVHDQVAERLDPRLVRDPEVFVTPAVQHSRALGGNDARELGGEARLSHAGLAADERRTTFAGARVLPRALQSLELRSAAHEQLVRGIAKDNRDRKRHARGALDRGVGQSSSGFCNRIASSRPTSSLLGSMPSSSPRWRRSRP